MPLQIPGLPPLPASFPTFSPALLTKDGVSQSQTPQKWGIYKGGKPIVIFDTFLSIDYRQGWVIADFPLEQGAFESYDKVATPFDVRVRLGAGEKMKNRQALIDSVAAIAKTLDLYEVVTPEVTYTSVNVQHFDYRRTATNGLGLIVIELWLLEVRIKASQGAAGGASDASGNTATAATESTPFSSPQPLTNTFDPSGMTSFNGGTVNGILVPTPNTVFNFGPLQ